MLQTPSLLLEIQSIQLGMQNSVHVDVSEIVVISWVGGSKWINSIIAGYNILLIHTFFFQFSRIFSLFTSKSIHECSQATIQHLEERISHWIFLAST